VVPPIDLLPEQVDELWPRLAATAARFRPLHLVLGPASTFAPRTMTIHLAVEGDVEPLTRLRDQLRVAPLPQAERWPFVPHVTLREEASADLIDQSLGAFAEVRLDVEVDALRLLEHLPRPEGGRNWWRPIASGPLLAR